MLMVLGLLFRTAETQHLQPLAALQVLQQNLQAVAEAYGVTVDISFSLEVRPEWRQ
jgi:hypothetical protein